MLQIHNLRSESLKRTFVNLSIDESAIVPHMEITILRSTDCNTTLKKVVFVFVGYEYTVTFYNDRSGRRETVTGLVSSISGDNNCPGNQYITLKILPSKPVFDKTISITEGMPKCGCVLNAVPNGKYQEMETIDVPVRNMIDITYSMGTPRPPKKEIRVMLLGISAEIVRAVAIDLKMLYDNKDGAVKEINMHTDGIYHIAYFNPKDCTIYEFDGKLKSIEEVPDKPSPKDTIVREQVGMSDSIYNCTIENRTDKDKFLNGYPLKKDVKLVFDTSEDFSGTYETIYLSWLRDCTAIEEPIEEKPIPDEDKPSTDNPCCICNSKVEIVSGDTTAVINTIDKTVSYTIKGETGSAGQISLQELVDFYFGF